MAWLATLLSHASSSSHRSISGRSSPSRDGPLCSRHGHAEWGARLRHDVRCGWSAIRPPKTRGSPQSPVGAELSGATWPSKRPAPSYDLAPGRCPRVHTTDCTYFSARSDSMLVGSRPGCSNGPGPLAYNWSEPATCNFAAHAARACSLRAFKCRKSMRLLLQVS